MNSNKHDKFLYEIVPIRKKVGYKTLSNFFFPFQDYRFIINTFHKNMKQQSDQSIPPAGKTSELLLSKMHTLQRKSVQCNKNVNHIVDNLIQIIQKTQMQIQGQNQGSDEGLQKCLQKFNEKLTSLKPLKNIKDEFQDFYKKMSGLAKVMGECPPSPSAKIKRVFNDHQLRVVERGITEHYLREGEEACANLMEENIENKQVFLKCWELKNKIHNGDYDQVISWVEEQKLYEEKKNGLEYELKKLKLLQLIQNQESGNALQYFQIHLPKFIPHYEEQINMLMGYLMMSSPQYWADETQYNEFFKERYQRFKEIDVEKISDRFAKEFYQHHALTYHDPVKICYEIGSQHQREFLEKMTSVNEERDKLKALPFSIQMKSQNQYHSLFFCPVTKEVHDAKEGGALLPCGHVVSHAAMKKIDEGRNNRRAQKCPICQKEIARNSDKKVYF